MSPTNLRQGSLIRRRIFPRAMIKRGQTGRRFSQSNPWLKILVGSLSKSRVGGPLPVEWGRVVKETDSRLKLVEDFLRTKTTEFLKHFQEGGHMRGSARPKKTGRERVDGPDDSPCGKGAARGDSDAVPLPKSRPASSAPKADIRVMAEWMGGVRRLLHYASWRRRNGNHGSFT